MCFFCTFFFEDFWPSHLAKDPTPSSTPYSTPAPTPVATPRSGTDVLWSPNKMVGKQPDPEDLCWKNGADHGFCTICTVWVGLPPIFRDINEQPWEVADHFEAWRYWHRTIGHRSRYEWTMLLIHDIPKSMGSKLYKNRLLALPFCQPKAMGRTSGLCVCTLFCLFFVNAGFSGTLLVHVGRGMPILDLQIYLSFT